MNHPAIQVEHTAFMFELINRKTYKVLFSLALILTLLATLMVVSKVPGVQHINDKLAHGVMFFFLAFLYSHSLGRKYGIWAIITLTAFGFMIEAIQYLLPWRSFSLADWLADTTGIIAYDIIHRLKAAYFKRKLNNANH